jgi:hypothetical protein
LRRAKALRPAEVADRVIAEGQAVG